MPAAPACALLKNKEKSPSLVGNVTAAEVFEADDTSVRKTVYTHDELNRVATRKTLLKDQNGNYTSNGPTWSYTYYNEGYVKTETDPNTLTTQFFYDGEWRLTRVLNAAGDERENIYDQAGNLTHAVDENGKTTEFLYNHRGQLTKKTDPAGRYVEWFYDSAGLLISRKVNGKTEKVTAYDYDVLNRRTTETLPTGVADVPTPGQPHATVRSWEYDETHNVKRYVDGRGVICDYMRDGVGRVSQKDYTVPTNLQSIVPAVPTVTYGWNKNGQPLSMGNAHGTAAWSYDARNRVATERVGHGPTMSFAYDARSLVVGETAAGQSRLNTSHLYDAAGRRTSTTRDGQTTQFAWDNGYRRTQIALPNGTTQDYAFDQVNRITNIDYKKNGTRFEKYDYSLDAVGNVTALTTLNGNYSYGYDQAYQLTSESRTGLQAYSKSYSYDSEGNRLTMVNGGTTTNYTYNAADQLVSWNEGAKSCAYAYDREGNVIGKTLTDNGTTTDGWDFQYDAANRMDNAVQNAGGTQSLYNTYAGDGWQRVQSVNNGNTMRFGWNGDALLAEFDANGNLTAGYLNDGLDAPLYKTRFSNNGATITGQEFYHQDANGRVHHLTDGQGNIAEKYLYDAFGNQTILGDK